ncbi:MAG: hypothetical protein K0U24_07010 [Gammaproteobacteria bacterium]|nr:hypothetical protein [Gammaproteobacteria bacterium]MCH9763951.1 hypothetical protein [Gammaproteobacteria bacterium]
MPKQKMTDQEIKQCTDMTAQKAGCISQISHYEVSNDLMTSENEAKVFTPAFKQALCPAPVETQTAGEAFIYY